MLANCYLWQRLRYTPKTMEETPHERQHWSMGLSGRLLALTAAFVMLAEVLVFVPSISRFRLDYLQDRIAKAHLAVLALEAASDNRVGESLESELLYHAGVRAVVLKAPDRRMLMLSSRVPEAIDLTSDLRHETFVNWIGDALWTLLQRHNRVLRVIGPSPRQPDATIEVLLDEKPLREAMYAYSWRILALSLIISFITACLVFVSLQLLLVKPMRQIIESIMHFHSAPEDATAAIRPLARNDEIGRAQRELAAMQRDLRQALLQKTRLAALGTAVAKINHDLKNTLATAVLASDRLAAIDDPEVQRLVPRLVGAIDRAVDLCGRTLDYVRSEQPALHETRISLRALLTDVADSLQASARDGKGLQHIDVCVDAVALTADREQLYRVFMNLGINARQAGATTLRFETEPRHGCLAILVRDNGPGIAESVVTRLFQPFASGAINGSGLGLVIAREIVIAHGGKLTLATTGKDGTAFRIEFPGHRLRKAS